jgi:multimeric flavodoxin WrbA
MHNHFEKKIEQTIQYLQQKKKVLFLTTSTRWKGDDPNETPKSTQLAHTMKERIGNNIVSIIDVPSLKIYTCEGNVSSSQGNSCGPKDSALPDVDKNPSGNHRCWASINHSDDELWKISKALFESDAVVFFASIRWGQANAQYQTVIERLTWIENRHSTLKENNIVAHIDAGIITFGHNWNGNTVNETQQKTLGFYGFNVVPALCIHWQHTTVDDETPQSYVTAAQTFQEELLHIGRKNSH